MATIAATKEITFTQKYFFKFGELQRKKGASLNWNIIFVFVIPLITNNHPL